MPYHCAKAVCATFCQRIAGALIPIFGPDFPSLCTPADTPEYSRMVINPEIVARATRDAEIFRRMYNNVPATDASSSAASVGVGLGRDRVRDRDRDRDRDRRVMLRDPYEEGRSHQLQLQLHRQHQQPHPHPHPYQQHQHHHHHQAPRHHHPRLRKTFMERQPDESPYPGTGTGTGTDTEGETSPTTTDRSSVADERYIYSPGPPGAPAPASTAAVIPSFRTHSGWTPANMLPHYEAPGPSPWLSAVPRLASTSAGSGGTTAAGPPLGPPHPRRHAHPHSHPNPVHLPPPPPRLPRVFPPHTLEAAASAAAAAAAAAAMATTSISKTAYPSPQKHHAWRAATPAATPGPGPGPGCKRSADHIVDSDYERECGEDKAEAPGESHATTQSTNTAAASPTGRRPQKPDLRRCHGGPAGGSGSGGGAADKNAALLLMNLSFRDSVGGCGPAATPAPAGGGRSTTAGRGAPARGGSGDSGRDDDAGTAASSATSSPRGYAGDGSFRRAKRIRSSSM